MGIDLYFYYGLFTLPTYCQPSTRVIVYTVFALLLGLNSVLLIWCAWQRERLAFKAIKQIFINLILMAYMAKIFGIFVLFLNDIIRLGQSLWHKFVSMGTLPLLQTTLPRSLIWMQASMVATGVPLVIMGYGIAVGAHAYRLRRVRIQLPHLPASFHGIKIAQLSDIHSGSFFNKPAVARGMGLLLAEKPDLIFFTGDLVNDTADEVKPYLSIFSQIKAPLGVYSVLGNHDFGDYVSWPSPSAKAKNLTNLCKFHEVLGWKLLRNTHHVLTLGGDSIAILGVDNWGGSFSKYGNLAQAYQGAEAMPVKLLLSHDPSHWDLEIRPHYSAIDVTFSGHTHGFQFGIETGSFKWSPVQYKYKQWAGLYQQGSQYLYVNRGFGYIGYPGRIGIWPEITIVTLEKL